MKSNPEKSTSPRIHSPNLPTRLIWTFIIFALGIGVAGYLTYIAQYKQIYKTTSSELASIAQLKIDQITQWRKERLADVRLISNRLLLSLEIDDFPKNHSSISKALLDSSFRLVKEAYGYENVILTDLNQHVLLTLNPLGGGLDAETKALCAKTAASRQPTLGDFFRCTLCDEVHLDVAAPVFDSQGNPEAILILRSDPDEYLYPLIQTWPLPSKSGETLIIKQEGDSIIFLNELRHRRDTVLRLRLPLSSPDLPAAYAILHGEGMIEGRDYRGARVLSITRTVPNTDWCMVAKVDLAEIQAPLYWRTFYIGLATLVMIIAAGLALSIVYRQQQIAAYQSELNSERKRLSLLERFELLTRQANDIIILFDSDEKIVEVNERALETYGYSRDELVTLTANDLLSSELREEVNGKMEQLEYQNGIRFETFHKRKDGSMLPVEVSTRMIKMNGETYYQSIVRDISERKRLEEILMKEQEELKLIIDSSPIIVFYKDADGRFIRVNKEFAEALDMKEEDFIGKTVFDLYSSKIAQGMTDDDDEVLQSRRPKLGIIEQYESASGLKWVHTDKIPILDKNGEPTGLIGFAQDITERKRAEDTLKETRDFYETIIETTNDGIWIADENDNIFFVNRAMSKIAGVRKAEILGKNIQKDFPEETIREFKTFYNKAKKTFKPVSYETAVTTPAGRETIQSGWLIPYKDSQNRSNIICTIQDVTKERKAVRAMLESEAKYRLLYENAGLGIGYWTVDGTLISFNDVALRNMHGKTEHYVGKTVKELYGEEKGNVYLDRIKQACKSKRSQIYEDQIDLGSEIKWFRSIYSRITDKHNNVLGIQIMSDDITLLKTTEEELRHERDFAKSLIETAQAIILHLDTEGRIVNFNPYMEEISGYRLEEVKGKDWFSTFLPGSDRDEIRRIYKKAVSGIQTRGNVNAILTKEGRECYIEWYDKTLKNSAGETVGVLSTGRDITEHRETAIAVRISEEKYRTYVESSPNGIFIVDSNGNYIDANEAACRLTGYSRDELLNIGIKDLIPAESDPDTLKPFIDLTRTGEAHDEIAIKRKDGKVIYSSLDAVKLSDNRYLGFCSDITVRKQAEEELRKTGERLRSLAVHLQSAREEERAAIAREIHDELGQVLTALKIDITLLKNGFTDEQESLLRVTESMAKLIDQTSDTVSRISSELRPGLLDDLGLSVAIDWQIDEFRKRTGIDCVSHIEINEKRINRDVSTALFRILQETLTNIARHSKATKADVKLVEKNNQLELSVSDNGIGISRQQLEDSRSYGLLGMRERVNYFSGEFKITGKENEGTTVKAVIPLPGEGG